MEQVTCNKGLGECAIGGAPFCTKKCECVPDGYKLFSTRVRKQFKSVRVTYVFKNNKGESIEVKKTKK